MKGDYSRLTFDPARNVRAVTYQQGRPLDDASLNEASEVTLRRIESEALDVIGPSGAPLHGGGFRVVKDASALTPQEAQDPRNATPAGTPPFLVTAGRIYVEGVQVENHRLAAVGAAPVLPALQSDGRKLVYLKATIDHRTGIDMPDLLDPAFGDADTTGRTLVDWQVRVLSVAAASTCGDANADWTELTKPLDGRLKVTVDTTTQASDPCKLTAGAGYTRDENLLFRVEADSGVIVAPAVDDQPRFARAGLVVKVSRNNAAEVAQVEKVAGNEITVAAGTRDGMPVFRVGEYVEVLEPGDATDVGVQRGWARIEAVDGEVVTLAAGHNAVDHARLRLWSMDRVTLSAANGFSVALDGIKFEFLDDGYRRGTYFLVPARHALSDVMLSSELRAALPPTGPQVHYLRLAMLDVVGGVVQAAIDDCRKVFEPLTEQLAFHYAGGDGQDALPGAKLPQPLRVRVAHGRFPLPGARVKFDVASGGGTLGAPAVGPSLTVTTDADGHATCEWTLGPSPLPADRSQAVTAQLLDDALAVRPGCRVVFAGTASASLVSRGGDGQEARAGEALEQPIEVRVANGQAPLRNARVEFTVTEGGGAIVTPSPVDTDIDGVARAQWRLGAGGKQHVEARWTDANGALVQAVGFHASVEAAAGGGCAVTIGHEGQFEKLDSDLLKHLLQQHRGHLCLCLLAGMHDWGDLLADGAGEGRLSIHGCGAATQVRMEARATFKRFRSVEIRSAGFMTKPGAGFDFGDCAAVTVDSLDAQCEDASGRPLFEFMPAGEVAVTDTRARVALPGLCAIVHGAEGSVQMSGNDLGGLVTFHGPPGTNTVPLQPIDLPALRARLRSPKQLRAAGGRLRLVSNRFDALAIGRDMMARIDALAQGQIDGIDGLYADALLAANSFAVTGPHLVATRITLSGNAFMGKPLADQIAGVFIAGQAAACATVTDALPPAHAVHLVTPPQFSREAGNVAQVVVS